MGDASGREGSPCRLVVARTLAALLAVLALGACRADLSVEVATAARGGGHVLATLVLDREAAAQVPDLARQLRVEDLEGAGWEIAGPEPADGGGVTLRVSRHFSSADDAARALEELSGVGGPFSTLHLARERGLWKTKTVLSGTVDLTAGLGAFGDLALAGKLGAPNLGLDPAALERDLGKPLAQAVHVEVVGRLPGSVRSNAPSTRAGAAVWPVTLGGVSKLSASSEAWNGASVVFGGLALVSALALLVVLVRRRR